MMATPNFTAANPSAPNASLIGSIGDQIVGVPRIMQDAAHQQGVMTSHFTQRQMPQLQSRIASAGQFYSTNRQRDEGFASQDFLNSSYDVQSAMQRQLDDLTRQRMYATLGMIA